MERDHNYSINVLSYEDIPELYDDRIRRPA
jgi:hypothetical protein